VRSARSRFRFTPFTVLIGVVSLFFLSWFAAFQSGPLASRGMKGCPQEKDLSFVSHFLPGLRNLN